MLTTRTHEKRAERGLARHSKSWVALPVLSVKETSDTGRVEAETSIFETGRQQYRDLDGLAMEHGLETSTHKAQGGWDMECGIGSAHPTSPAQDLMVISQRNPLCVLQKRWNVGWGQGHAGEPLGMGDSEGGNPSRGKEPDDFYQWDGLEWQRIGIPVSTGPGYPSSGRAAQADVRRPSMPLENSVNMTHKRNIH
ncbi:hypothetical protein CPB86DRAFT_802888 [Serendipita vermifera]|nr:hypothetical protein CPB86DRAFT_802888 [Serendipita vermifera]